MKPLLSRLLVLLCLGFLASPLGLQAQWVTQTFRLEPGWNAIYLHVDPSYRTLEEMIPSATDPVAEIWMWQPGSVTNVANTRWSQWTANRGDADTLTRLVGNVAYLVRNSGSNALNWSVKGKPLPPAYEWTTTGLNFLGFPTPAATAPRFDQFLGPAPGLDPARSSENLVEIIHYPGGVGEGGVPNPTVLASLVARTTPVTRGKAFWVRAATNYYNHYYGPVEVAFQNPKGVDFRDALGVYSVRLRNLTSTNRTVTFNVLPSEAAPSGQPAIFAVPQLLVRGERNSTNLSYAHTVLSGNQFTLAPAGQPGSEREVVVGLNRKGMTGPAGSLYAGILRITDTDGLSQVDAPVTAVVPSLGGLWVGEASVDRVGQYLKSYPRMNTTPPPAPRSSYLELDGVSGYATLPAASYFGAGGFTVEAWVNIRSHQNWQRLIDFGHAADVQNVLLALSLGGSGRAHFSVRRPGNTTVGIETDEPLPLNVWTHLAVVQDAPTGNATTANTRLFVNGTLRKAGVINVPLDVVRTNNFMGRSNWSTDAYASARIDDFRIWSMPRSVEDLRRDMAMGRYPAMTPGLLVQYDFPAGTEPGEDSSGASRDLTLQGNASRADAVVGSADTLTSSLAQTAVLTGRQLPGAELTGAAWENRTPGVNRNYASIASSQDGRILLAADSDGAGRLHVSTNSGASWAAVGPAGIGSWRTVAASGAGTLLAAAANNQRIYLSRDFGSTWTAVESARAWSGLAVSADGTKLLASVLGAKLYTSSNGGTSWQERESIRNWIAVASSGDGTRLLAAVSGGTLYASTDAGATWTARDTTRTWSSVASSADGLSLIASANTATSGGQLYTSTDGGLTWQAREANRAWTAVASSSDGRRLTAVVNGGGVYASTDAGLTWSLQDPSANWIAVASSGDGGRLSAAVLGGGLYTRTRQFVSYTVDAETGLVRDQAGAYLSSGVNTNMARTASALPMRLILHQDASTVKMLQRIYVGQGASTSAIIVANRESFLDRSKIGAARRLSAAHLPFTAENLPWPATGQFQAGAVLTFEVTEDYNDHGSNPFLHTFHPDHDNLTTDFKSVQALGAESYGITRRIQLTLDSPGNDFLSLTASSLVVSGRYAETMTLAGRSGASREYRLAGTFAAQRISPIATLTTQ